MLNRKKFFYIMLMFSPKEISGMSLSVFDKFVDDVYKRIVDEEYLENLGDKKCYFDHKENKLNVC